MKTLLHPTDFTANSEQAFQIACSLARDSNAGLIVLHVVSPRECARFDLDGDDLNPDSDLYQSVWSRFDQLRTLAGRAKVSFEVRIGELFDSLLDVARKKHCDLIVIAGRHHLSSYYQVHGCISESLFRRAPCSVLVLRHFHSDDSQMSDVSNSPLTSWEIGPDCGGSAGNTVGTHGESEQNILVTRQKAK